MGRESLFKEIKLPSLSEGDVGGIAESMLGGKAHSSFIKRLASESRGVPLYVVESIRMLYEEEESYSDGWGMASQLGEVQYSSEGQGRYSSKSGIVETDATKSA